MRIPFAAAALLLAWLPAVPARAGHEFPFYPSFYPQEITIQVTAPAAGAEGLGKGTLHAYVGADPFENAPVPSNVGHAEFLGGWVVLTPNPAAADRQARCTSAARALQALRPGTFEPHPYPVTPYHADYLHHGDLAEAARGEMHAAGEGPVLRLLARGPLAERLVHAPAPSDQPWDVSVEVVEAQRLLAAHAVALNGWLGPPWLKEGWFHAWLLLAEGVTNPGARQAATATFERLARGEHRDLVERLNLERKLVSLLRGGCERVVAGYTVKRERFYAEYSGGVENIGHDSHTGFHSAAFLRTVKLKDFPWNGWLTLGVPARPEAAWNPFGGLSDPTGRLLWLALGDPALFPAPGSASWVPNRVTATLEEGRPALEVPHDALLPEPGTGLFKKVKPGARALARVSYRVLTSAFHDGSRMSPGDVVYPLAFAARWAERDPAVGGATALLRERLAGVRLLRVERDVLAFGDVKLEYEVPVLDLYVNFRAGDPLQVATLAAPWSSLPWHVTALMEEAVARGLAAFSREEATRLSVPWMDLARDRRLAGALLAILDDLARKRHVPEALKALVGAQEARERWSALRHFYDNHGHFLVTNGPYQLERWTEDSVVLRVFRDLSFPRGVGSYDRLAVPLRSFVTKTEVQGDRLLVLADVERLERFGREQRIVREPFSRRAFERDRRALPLARFLTVGSDGTVVGAGSAAPGEDDRFVVPLRETGRRGPYTVLVAVELEGHRANLPFKAVPWTP
jgi:hypothetical protein